MMKKSSIWLLSIVFLLSIGIPSASASEPIPAQERLGLYYGWPSLVNGAAGNLTTAANTFAQYDQIVFGAGIADSSHGDHSNTQTIINNLNLLGGKEIFGYVNLGCPVPDPNETTVTTIKSNIDKWDAMGVQGVFLDCAGFDYGVTRVKQDQITDYAHSVGLNVFMNAWNPDDISGDLDENGMSNPSSVRAGDWYLAESWLISDNSYLSISDWAVKADKCRNYQSAKGIKTAVVSTNVASGATSGDHTTDKFKMAWWAAAMYGFSFQWTDIWYSAGNNALNYYAHLSTSYGTSFEGNPVHESSATTNFRATNAGVIYVTGNGSTTGTGTFGVYPTITIDGSAADWSGITALSTGTSSVKSLKVTQNSDNLYLFVGGTSLNGAGVIKQFYLITDNNIATGYNPTGWSSGGADYLLENNILYSYTGTGNSWSWSSVVTLSSSQYSYHATVIEAAVPLANLGLAIGDKIRVGYIHNNSSTNRLPEGTSLPEVRLLP